MVYRFIKRTFDICASLLAILISSPVWLIIAIGIKLSSKGPVFYRADRIGKGGKKFVLYKFRSMHVFVTEDKSAGEKREGGYIANENRIFKFGGILRKTKLDELPQLLNILMGQMSVVGPRPITEAGVKKHYIGKYDNVLTVRPGLACLDSLYDYAHGELFIKDNEEFDKKVQAGKWTEIVSTKDQFTGINATLIVPPQIISRPLLPLLFNTYCLTMGALHSRA